MSIKKTSPPFYLTHWYTVLDIIKTITIRSRQRRPLRRKGCIWTFYYILRINLSWYLINTKRTVRNDNSIRQTDKMTPLKTFGIAIHFHSMRSSLERLTRRLISLFLNSYKSIGIVSTNSISCIYHLYARKNSIVIYEKSV